MQKIGQFYRHFPCFAQKNMICPLSMMDYTCHFFESSEYCNIFATTKE